jgi:thiol:disulfide interchange protein DsbC
MVLFWMLVGVVVYNQNTAAQTLNDSRESSLQSIQAAIQKTLPNTIIDRIDKVKELPGLYEVQTGENIIYTTKDGRYIIFGILVDGKTEENLTAKRIQEIAEKRYKSLPDKMAIYLKGDSKKGKALFVDPATEDGRLAIKNAMKEANIKIFFLPQLLMNKLSAKMTRAVWCRSDREQALIDLIKGKINPVSDCQAPIQKMRETAKEAHIESVPSVILPNGRVMVLSEGT